MTITSRPKRTIDVFRLPSPASFVAVVVLAGFTVGMLGASVSGISLTISVSTFTQFIQERGVTIATLFPLLLFSVFISAQIVIVPLFSALLILIKPALVQRRLGTYDIGQTSPETKVRFTRLLNRLKIDREVGLLTTDRSAPPQVYGLLSPRILIPRPFIETLPPGQLDALFLHEAAHIADNDLAALEIPMTLARSLLGAIAISVVLSIGAIMSLPLAYFELRRSTIANVVLSQLDSSLGFSVVGLLGYSIGLLLLNYIILSLSIRVIALIRERRADLRARYLLGDRFGDLVVLISKGARKPGLLAKILQLGPDRWTRHETLLQPERLIRPNVPFLFLFGMFQGLLLLQLSVNISLQLGSFALFGAFENLGRLPIATPELAEAWLIPLASLSSFILMISNGLWLYGSQLSYSVTRERKLKSELAGLGWVVAASVVMSAGRSLFIPIYSPLAAAMSFIGPTIAIIDLNFVGAYLLASTIQGLTLASYLLIPKLQTRTSIWLVYIPVLIILLALVVTFTMSYVLTPDYFAQWTNFYAQGPLLSPEQQLSGISHLLNAFDPFSIPLSFRIRYILVLFTGFMFALGVFDSFERCLCCGQETSNDFSIDYQCDNCKYPLGSWISTDPLPDPDIYFKSVDSQSVPLTWRTALTARLRGIVMTIVMIGGILGAAWLGYSLYTRSEVFASVSSGFARAILAATSFLCVGFLLLIVAVLVFRFLGWLGED